MLAYVFFFFSMWSGADELKQDLHRLEAFQQYMLKKDAYEQKREATAKEIAVKRAARIERYEKMRENFKREEPKAPQGMEVYDKLYTRLEERIAKKRAEYLSKKMELTPALEEKMDKVKMKEYSIETH
jgi:hypothetical protein